MKDEIARQIRESIAVKEQLLQTQVDVIARMAEVLRRAMCDGGKMLLCGNGGSAADCQHLAGEMVGRFRRERKALPAIALTTDTSILTAIGNDYGFERIFARQVEAHARKGDVVLGFSTSGNSRNVIEALKTGKSLGCATLAFTGGTGGEMSKVADLVLVVPSDRTWRIQECHITVGHILCDLVEAATCGE
jgi:D-sedoheptulose 7-phosphate isomerase